MEELLIPEGGVLFIDEIHGLPKPVADLLYAAMDDKKICAMTMIKNT